jgi:outer membrane protein assembly factor BamE (lipoprotein component of BamABCDE complex)
MTAPLIPKTRSALLLLAIVSLLTACITIGRAFPSQQIPTLAVGKTTQAEVQNLYGPPFRTGVEDGDPTWTYVNYKLRIFGQQCTQDLVVRFNADGRVKSYTYNTTGPGSCD